MNHLGRKVDSNSNRASDCSGEVLAKKVAPPTLQIKSLPKEAFVRHTAQCHAVIAPYAGSITGKQELRKYQLVVSLLRKPKPYHYKYK